MPCSSQGIRKCYSITWVQSKTLCPTAQYAITSMNEFIFYRSPPNLEVPLHPFKAGDQVLLKVWKEQGPDQQPEEKWKGSYDILLTIHTSLKLEGVKPWIHHTWVKRLPEMGPHPGTSEPTPTIERKPQEWTSQPTGDLKYLFKQKKWWLEFYTGLY